MDTIPLNPERRMQLERLQQFAQSHGRTPAATLQDAVTTYFEGQSDTFEQEVAAIQQGYEDVKAGRVVSLKEFAQHMREKYGIPR